MSALSTRVAASRKGARTRAVLNLGRGYGPKGAKRGAAGGGHEIGAILARIREQGE